MSGDLGVKPDGTAIGGSHDGDYEYFCKTLVEVLNTKSNNYDNLNPNDTSLHYYTDDKGYTINRELLIGELDRNCKDFAASYGDYIQTVDDIIYYQTDQIATPFGKFDKYLTYILLL